MDESANRAKVSFDHVLISNQKEEKERGASREDGKGTGNGEEEGRTHTTPLGRAPDIEPGGRQRYRSNLWNNLYRLRRQAAAPQIQI